MKISLEAARVNAGFTQKEVAKALKKTNQTIVNWENGKTFPKISDFENLCNLYKISKDNIFFNK